MMPAAVDRRETESWEGWWGTSGEEWGTSEGTLEGTSERPVEGLETIGELSQDPCESETHEKGYVPREKACARVEKSALLVEFCMLLVKVCVSFVIHALMVKVTCVPLVKEMGVASLLMAWMIENHLEQRL